MCEQGGYTQMTPSSSEVERVLTMKLHATVRLRVALPEHGLPSGSNGAVVAIFDTPSRAYEVEFADHEREHNRRGGAS